MQLRFPDRSARRPLFHGLAVLSLVLVTGPAFALSARDKAASDALDVRMAQAEARYREAKVMVGNADPNGQVEANAAIEDMEDILAACVKQKGCQVPTQLATFKRLLKIDADAESPAADDPAGDSGNIADFHANPLAADAPEAVRAAALLDDQRHQFDRMVQYNPAIQASIRRWLTDLRPSLMTSYENYTYLRFLMWPQYEKAGLPEALLFGIMTKESNGKVHVSSRTGAAGLMQFMPATGRRFGLGPDGTGFDTRFDPRAAAEASVSYLNERMRGMNNNIELALAAYNGGEGRAQRVYNENPGRSFWEESVYNQFPAETKDYVPMVIAAAWLFLHPKEYGLDFPRPNFQPSLQTLAKATSMYELTICLGSSGTREGYLRILRNLNPRYQPSDYIPQGASLSMTTRMTELYKRNCVAGPRAELARTLMNADLGTAIVRPAAFTGTVAVGDPSTMPVAIPQGVPTTVAIGRPVPAKPKAAQVRSYKVAKGDTLGRVVNKFDCEIKDLAKANGLKAPGYAVKPGQVLKLAGCSK